MRTSPSKKALILCNGQPPPKALLTEWLSQSSLFIAADGGANVALSMDQTPDVVVGDLDSYEPVESIDIETIRNPDQYSNDLEKALKLAKEKNVTHAYVLGATGLRLDYTLKNLSVLKRFDNRFKEIVFLDKYGLIRLLPSSFTQKIPEGTAISLFPLSGLVTGITTQGLKYELHEGKLQNGVHDGLSNTIVSSPVKIEHQTGDLLLFVRLTQLNIINKLIS